MAKDVKIICPLMHKQCIEDGTLVDGEIHACRFWVHVVGKDPQTGAESKHGDCAFAWTPMLMIENTAQQRSTSAAVESFRNEMVKAQEQSNQILLGAAMAAQNRISGKTYVE